MSDRSEDEEGPRLRRLARWRPTGKQAVIGAGLLGLVALAVLTKGEILEGAEPIDLLSGWGGTHDDDDNDRKPPRGPDPPDDASLVYLE